MPEQKATQPSGVSLKAAYLLLKELKRYPQLPSIEQLAIILDDTLCYEWAVRIIRNEQVFNAGLYCRDDAVIAFNEWAENVLLGPDFRDVPDGPDVHVLPAPTERQGCAGKDPQA
jgi:hypothetical protein